MPSTDQACVPAPVSIVAGRGVGRSASTPASPAPSPTCGLQKYDTRIAHCGRGPPVSSPRKNDEEPPLARASRLTADDRRWPARPVVRTLTPKVALNNSAIDELGFCRVNFASAVFSREHLLIRPGVHLSTGRCAKMTDFTVDGDLFVDRLAALTPFPQRNRTAPARHAHSAIQLSDAFTSRFART